MNTNNIIQEILTEEEQKFLLGIEAKIVDKLKELEKTKYDHLDNDEPLDLSSKHSEIIPPIHITDSPHEIRISVTTEISGIDDKGYVNEIKEMFRKNYHIPVPANQDYMVYANKFFETLEIKLASTFKESLSTDNTTND